MTIRQTRRTGQVARLLGGVSASVLLTFAPISAQAEVTLTLPTALDAFTLASVTNVGTAANTTQLREAGVTASIDSNEVTGQIAGTFGTSSATAESNLLSATARGNVLDVSSQILGDDQSGRVGILSGQISTGGTISTVGSSSISVTATEVMTDSAAAASGNVFEARTDVNVGRTLLDDSIGADEVSGLLADNTAFAANTLTAAGGLTISQGSSVVAGSQVITGAAAASSANVTGNTLTITLDAAPTGPTSGGAEDATGSTIEINENRLAASLTGNRAVVGTLLDVDTAMTGSAGSFNQQIINDAAVNLLASNTGSLMTVNVGDLDGTAVSISDNAISSAVSGNVTLPNGNGNGNGDPAGTFLSITATSIDGARAVVEATGTTVNAAGQIAFEGSGSESADFQVANQQLIADTDAGGTIRAQTLGAALTANVGDVGNTAGANVSLDGNRIDAAATANISSSLLNLSAVSIDATATLANAQGVIGTDTEAEVGGNIGVVSQTGVDDSAISVDANTLRADAEGNVGTNRLTVAASGALTATTTADTSVSIATALTSTADLGLVSSQQRDAGSSVSAIVDGDLSIDDSVAGTGVTGSAVTVDDNLQVALARGNRVENTATISGLGVDTTTGLLTLQSGLAAVTGTSNLTLGIETVDDAGAEIVNASQLSVSGNTNVALAQQNTGSSTLSVSGTSIEGNRDIGTLADARLLTDTGVLAANADNALGNRQVSEGDVNATANTLANISAIGGAAAAAFNSNLELSGNTTQAIGGANIGTNTLRLTADTGLTANAALTSDQSSDSAVTGSAVFGVANAAVGDIEPNSITFAGTITGSSLAMDDNVALSSARGNEALNTLDASATSILRTPATGTSASFDSVAESINSTADFALTSRQVQTGAVASDARILTAITGAAADEVGTSSLSISGNFADTTAEGNRATNRVALNTGGALSAGAAITSFQQSTGAIDSFGQLRAVIGAGTGELGDINSSSLEIRDNTVIARAAANDVTNVLNARAGTTVTGFGAVGSGVLNGGTDIATATADFAMVNRQDSSSAVTARASFTDGNASDLAIRTAALDGSSVAIGGNRLVADAVGNRAVSRMEVGGTNLSGVSVASVNAQTNSGAVTSRVDSARLASLSGAVTGSSVGLNGNTLSASAGGNVATSRLIRD